MLFLRVIFSPQVQGVQHPLNQGIRGIAAVFMNHQALRLIHQQYIFIFVYHFDLRRRRQKFVFRLLLKKFIVDVKLDTISGLKLLPDLSPLAVHLDPLEPQILIHQTGRQPGHCFLQKLIQPLTGIIWLDPQFFHKRFLSLLLGRLSL